MLTVYSGRYHPDLEHAFIERIKGHKKDPLAALAVVTASRRLKDYLELLLGSQRTTYLNIHFHTFPSFVDEILVHDDEDRKPALSDGLFYDTLVGQLLREIRPFRSYAELAVPDGFPNAVRSTLRDLLDAGVDGNLIRQAMDEQFLGRDVDLGSLRELLTLYRAYLDRLDKLPIIPMTRRMELATLVGPRSPYLQKFADIMFYGFYDLTGVQSEFFKSIADQFPTSFFFPYVAKEPAYGFAKRFRDNTLQQIHFNEHSLSENESLEVPQIKIFNVSGHSDEAWLVGQEVRRLHEEEKIEFAQIAVIARSRDRLLKSLPTVLREKEIPFQTSAPILLLEWPLATLVGEFLSLIDLEVLPLRDFEFLHHPDFKGTLMEVWSATRDWPDLQTWSDHATQADRLLHQFFSPSSPESSELWSVIYESIHSLHSFDQLDRRVSPRDFLETLGKRWAQTDPGWERGASNGISLLHAEAARGLFFEAVILIGVEEKEFPRIIREDPFLRDSARQALRDTVGYKIGQKLTALEEERLLFHLVTTAAKQELIFIYQRSDDDGKVVGASPFLRSLASQNNWNLDKVVSVPRILFQKLNEQPVARLSFREIIIRWCDQKREKMSLSLARKLSLSADDLARGLAVQQALHQFDNPHAYDGLLGSLTEEDIFPRGVISPSALERYGKCPYQFHAVRMLDLQPPDELGTRVDLPPDIKGKLLHLFLEQYFRTITQVERSQDHQKISSDVFDRLFESIFPVRCPEADAVPPLLWKIIRINLRRDLTTYIESELVRLQKKPAKTMFFEQGWTGALPLPMEKIRWTGTMDRIEVGPSDAWVIDYKSGKIPTSSGIVLEALRGRRIQPLLYRLMAQNFLSKQGEKVGDINFAYHQIGRNFDQSEFTARDWRDHQEELVKTLESQINMLRNGVFLIYPHTEPGNSSDRYCQYCEVDPICRRHHSVSAYRATQGPGEALLSLRTKKGRRSSP